jgi:GT2 family glycosyltransferase
MQLSIVVTSYDLQRKQDIMDLLGSIQAQVCNDFEVLYITERSRSLYDFVKKALAQRGIKGKVIHNNIAKGLSFCRNIGIEHSDGDIVAFVDDDAIVSSNWACTIAESFRNPRIAAVTGPVIPLFNDSSIAQIPKAFHWLFGCSTWADYSDGEIIRNVWGANMAFKRTALKNVGGFSDQIGGVFGLRLHGEENELSMRLGNVGHVVFLKDMCVLHKVTRERIGTRFVLRSSYWMGFTRYVLNKNYGKLHPLSLELNIMRSVLIDGIIASILNLLRSRQNSVMILRVSILVVVSSIAGYVAAMVKEAFADRLDSHI